MGVGTASAESVRDFLDRAERLAPADDRIGLGRANLAIRQGAFAEAANRIDACLRRHPEDVPAWRARLDWAMATGRVAEAREALDHLPAAEASPAELYRLAAWFAARRGDVASERRSLQQLAEADPADGAAFDRLAELAVREGQPARAAELRRRKAELDQLKAQYQELLLRDQPVRDAAKMADLAEQLGHWFEAKVFASVALATEPGRDDLRAALARLKSRAQLRRRVRTDFGRRARCRARRAPGGSSSRARRHGGPGRYGRSHRIRGRFRPGRAEPRLRQWGIHRSIRCRKSQAAGSA